MDLSDIPGEPSACGMPVEQQIERLKRALEARGVTECDVINPDLYDLEGADLTAALDAMVAGELSPFVIVDGRMLCTGGVQVDTVLGALV